MKKAIKNLGIIVVVSAVSIFSYRAFEPKNHSCKDYDGEISKLSVDLINDMVSRYRGKRDKINSSLKINDAHSVWFDLETLKKFIYQVESISKANDKSISSEMLGLRIYYGDYPSIDTWGKPEYKGALIDFQNNSITNKYEKLHTLIMIPTIKKTLKNIEYNIDFNPDDPRTYSTNQRLSDFYNSAHSKTIFSTAALPVLMSLNPTGPLSQSAQNHGSLIPPRKPGTSEEGF